MPCAQNDTRRGLARSGTGDNRKQALFRLEHKRPTRPADGGSRGKLAPQALHQCLVSFAPSPQSVATPHPQQRKEPKQKPPDWVVSVLYLEVKMTTQIYHSNSSRDHSSLQYIEGISLSKTIGKNTYSAIEMSCFIQPKIIL